MPAFPRETLLTMSQCLAAYTTESADDVDSMHITTTLAVLGFGLLQVIGLGLSSSGSLYMYIYKEPLLLRATTMDDTPVSVYHPSSSRHMVDLIPHGRPKSVGWGSRGPGSGVPGPL